MLEGVLESSKVIIGTDHPVTLERVKSLHAWTLKGG
jgi:hypothetical protein